MLDFILRYKKFAIAIALGAVAGFLYWRFIGCNSGTCPITSKWYTTSVYGALIGALMVNTRKKEESTNIEKKEG